MECKEQQFNTPEGSATATTYTIYPGVEMTYYTSHMPSLTLDNAVPGRVLEIFFCYHGVSEMKFATRSGIITAGHLAMALRKEGTATSIRFHHGRRAGMVVRVALDELCPHFMELMDEMCVDLSDLIRNLSGERDHFIFSDHDMREVILELCCTTESMREGYSKLKILELLLNASQLDPAEYENMSSLYECVGSNEN